MICSLLLAAALAATNQPVQAVLPFTNQQGNVESDRSGKNRRKLTPEERQKLKERMKARRATAKANRDEVQCRREAYRKTQERIRKWVDPKLLEELKRK